MYNVWADLLGGISIIVMGITAIVFLRVGIDIWQEGPEGIRRARIKQEEQKKVRELMKKLRIRF